MRHHMMDQVGGAMTKESIYNNYQKPLQERLDKDLSFTAEELNGLPVDFVNANPTDDLNYLEWIVRSYIRGGIKRYDDLLTRVRPALVTYLGLLDRKKLNTGIEGKPWTNERDIRNYCGLTGCKYAKYEVDGLEKLLEKYQHVFQPERSWSKQDRIFFNGNDIKIYVPETEEEACYYGRGTRWCTAATGSKNPFDNYYKDSPLYIIVPKNPDHIGEKYQLHKASRQYMDEYDSPTDLIALCEMYPELIQFLNLWTDPIYESNDGNALYEFNGQEFIVYEDTIHVITDGFIIDDFRTSIIYYKKHRDIFHILLTRYFTTQMFWLDKKLLDLLVEVDENLATTLPSEVIGKILDQCLSTYKQHPYTGRLLSEIERSGILITITPDLCRRIFEFYEIDDNVAATIAPYLYLSEIYMMREIAKEIRYMPRLEAKVTALKHVYPEMSDQQIIDMLVDEIRKGLLLQLRPRSYMYVQEQERERTLNRIAIDMLKASILSDNEILKILNRHGMTA